MNKLHSLLLFTISAVVPVACSTPDKDNLPVSASGVYLDSAESGISQSKIRQPETVKQYAFNPYVDPNNPDTRYSEGVVHRVEQTPQWNLTPGAHLEAPLTTDTGVAVAGRKNVEEGPLEDIANDQAVSPQSVPARLEQELARERQYRQALTEQLQGQIEITKTFTQQLAEVKQLAEQNRQLHAELKTFQDTEAQQQAEAKARADADAARKSLPFYKRWFTR